MFDIDPLSSEQLAPCSCMVSPSPNKPVLVDLGMDAAYREVALLACPICGRPWLRLHQEDEAFTASGRWYLGAIDPEQVASLTAQNAKAALEGLSWYFFGGSYFDGKIGRTSGKIW